MRSALLACIALAAAALAFTAAGHSMPAAHARVSRDIVLQAADGIAIDARLYETGNDDVIVYCHRLLGGKEGGEVRLLAEAVADRYDLMTFDFRGHKSSLGTATIGGDEVLDLRAALSCAKKMGYRRTIVLGAGMGGTVGWRTAELFGNMDALIVVSPSGLTPWTAPFVVRLVSDKMLTTSIGRVPLRIITKTRLGFTSERGYPLNLSEAPRRVPTLVIQSEKDRFVNVRRLVVSFEDFADSKSLMIVPGRKHAEDLIDRSTIARVRTFLDSLFRDDGGRPVSAAERVAGNPVSPGHPADAVRIALEDDSPLPDRVVLDEFEERARNRVFEADVDRLGADPIARELLEIYAMHGYTRTSVDVSDSLPPYRAKVSSPRIRAVSIAGNRWLKEDYIRGVARLGGDAFNAYELDLAVRRLGAEPAVQSATYRVIEREDGDVDVVVDVIERRPYRFLLSTKFTDVDDYAGVGFTWNEVNPTALRYEGRAMIGLLDQDFLTFHTVSKDYLRNSLRLGATFFDNIKSRDDLDYVFTRQEVREIGGEFAARYRALSSTALTIGLYGKEYSSSVVRPGLPVEEGSAAGVRCMLDLSGALPLRRLPRFLWRNTVYFEKAGPFRLGDFSFETYQANLSGELKLGRHHAARATVHAGRQNGAVPPQDAFSLGGMTTLRGYADDSFVGNRVVFASHALYLSARSVVGETSVWAPMRLVIYGDAGTAWGAGEGFSWNELRFDAGFELDYMEMLRAGCVWPVGGLWEGSPRIYIGWGAHVI